MEIILKVIKMNKICVICGKPITGKRRFYCSDVCRNKRNNTKYKEQHALWQIKRRDAIASIPSKNKKQCKICGKWYIQVGSHIVQKHDMTARKYREEFNLPVKKGITPQWYRKLKGKQALENKTCKNLIKGKKFRYKKGDPKAKINIGWKGRRYKSDEFYG
jgi:predicted nucleic acid-binding Zn ribbon protein